MTQTMQSLLDAIAAGTPAPGGGYVAATTGAMGAALVSMVCNLTLSRVQFKLVENQIQATLAQSEAIRAKLAQLAHADQIAVQTLMTAISLSKVTTAQQIARRQAIQDGYKEATITSIAIATACATVMKLGHLVAETGNPNAWGDAQAAIFCGKAGVSTSALNGYLNLARVKDKAFVTTQQLALDTVLASCKLVKEEVLHFR